MGHWKQRSSFEENYLQVQTTRGGSRDPIPRLQAQKLKRSEMNPQPQFISPPGVVPFTNSGAVPDASIYLDGSRERLQNLISIQLGAASEKPAIREVYETVKNFMRRSQEMRQVLGPSPAPRATEKNGA